MKHFIYDVLAILLFAIFARLAHKSEAFTPVNVFNTWWPFAIGVVMAWAFLAWKKRRGLSMASGTIVWLCTVVCGLGIWAAEHGRTPHISFIIVATVMSGLLLFGWRLIAGMLAKKKA